MSATMSANTLHRLVKQAMDSGQSSTVEEAEAMFRGYRLAFQIENSQDAGHQAALLTGVALARRVFLGGVTVAGELDVPLAVPLPLGTTLRAAVQNLGASVGEAVAEGIPLISISRDPQPKSNGFHVRTVFAGWRGGIVPAHADTVLVGAEAMALSPMLAAALAVNEAYLFVRGDTGDAGRRHHGLSLWRPSAATDWLDKDHDGPILDYLPSRLWLIGLGHLGQAYLWALGLLPYPQPSDLELVLQDVDEITLSSESTSILSDDSLVGKRKTRAMAAWAERRGFTTAIYERLFDGNFQKQDGEPAIALCGLDNAIGRQPLDRVGFDFVVEAGLGRDHRNFQTMRIHTLPAKRSAAEIWKSSEVGERTEDRSAYQALLDGGQLDQCGITLLAGKAVGAPFVGSAAACLVISEVLRLLHGGDVHQLIDVDLRSIDHRLAVINEHDFSAFNPGYVVTKDLT
jgi:hypothetical protein